MDKVTAKLDKVQQTVQINETEYRNYLKALNDTNAKWVSDWKAWCDVSRVQSIELQRVLTGLNPAMSRSGRRAYRLH